MHGPVRVSQLNTQELAQGGEPVASHLGVKPLGKSHGVYLGRIKGVPQAGQLCLQKGNIKLGVVGSQRVVFHELQKLRQRFIRPGGINQHGIGDAGDFDNLLAERHTRVYQA